MCGWMVSGAVVVVFFDANAMQAIHENLAGKMTVTRVRICPSQHTVMSPIPQSGHCGHILLYQVA